MNALSFFLASWALFSAAVKAALVSNAHQIANSSRKKRRTGIVQPKCQVQQFTCLISVRLRSDGQGGNI